MLALLIIELYKHTAFVDTPPAPPLRVSVTPRRRLAAPQYRRRPKPAPAAPVWQASGVGIRESTNTCEGSPMTHPVQNPTRAQGLPVTRVTRSLKPGQHGTLKLLRLYGSALVCVRYRENAQGSVRYTTIEIVVDEAPKLPRMSERCVLGVRIAWEEARLAARAKAMGARWDPGTRLWRMSYKAVKALNLQDRVRPKLSIHGQHP